MKAIHGESEGQQTTGKPLPDIFLCDAEQPSLLPRSSGADPTVTWWQNTCQATLQGQTVAVRCEIVNLNITNVINCND